MLPLDPTKSLQENLKNGVGIRSFGPFWTLPIKMPRCNGQVVGRSSATTASTSVEGQSTIISSCERSSLRSLPWFSKQRVKLHRSKKASTAGSKSDTQQKKPGKKKNLASNTPTCPAPRWSGNGFEGRISENGTCFPFWECNKQFLHKRQLIGGRSSAGRPKWAVFSLVSL